MSLKTATQLACGRKYSLAYQAIEDTTRRRPVVRKTTAESVILPGRKRHAAAGTARDDKRNMSILAWMVRRHLDCVSRFTPHFRIMGDTPEIEAINRIVRKLLQWHGRRKQFDALKRHGRDEFMRMFEACKVISGDAGALKVNGGFLQGIEGDRICKASGAPEDVSDEGLVFDAAGGVQSYALAKRTDNGMTHETIVPTNQMIFDAYWPDRFDANRGVSPLLTALNEAADVRETWEWLVLKTKASALFGLAFTRAGSDEMLPTLGEESDEAQGSELSSYTEQLSSAIKSRGIISLDLDPGDEVKEIQSNTPNPTVVPFTRELVRSVLLALDIPFTFYDSLTASFSARIADRNEYEEACEWKRAKNADVLNDIYGDWLFPMWESANVFGFGDAVNAAGITLDEVAATLRWVPAGRPWLDRSNEMSGHILALTAGVTSTPRICAAYGEDAYDIAQEQAEYLAKAGAPLLYANGGQQAVQTIMESIGQPKQDDKIALPETMPDE